MYTLNYSYFSYVRLLSVRLSKCVNVFLIERHVHTFQLNFCFRYVRLRSLTERLCVHLSIEVLSVAASKREHPLVSVADDIVVDYHLNKV